MLDKFKNILERIKVRGTVTLFAALKMDEYTDKWSIFLCAPWINEENREEVFSEIVQAMHEYMKEDETSTVARIVIQTEDEHLIQELLVFRTGEHIGGEESVKVNGNMIHDGYILESNRSAVSAIEN